MWNIMREAEGYLHIYSTTLLHTSYITMACERYGVMVRGVWAAWRWEPSASHRREPDGRHQVECLSLYLYLCGWCRSLCIEALPWTASPSLVIESHSYSWVKVGVLLFYTNLDQQPTNVPLMATMGVVKLSEGDTNELPLIPNVIRPLPEGGGPFLSLYLKVLGVRAFLVPQWGNSLEPMV